jgi:hypothetical protein
MVSGPEIARAVMEIEKFLDYSDVNKNSSVLYHDETKGVQKERLKTIRDNH